MPGPSESQGQHRALNPTLGHESLYSSPTASYCLPQQCRSTQWITDPQSEFPSSMPKKCQLRTVPTMVPSCSCDITYVVCCSFSLPPLLLTPPFPLRLISLPCFPTYIINFPAAPLLLSFNSKTQIKSTAALKFSRHQKLHTWKPRATFGHRCILLRSRYFEKLEWVTNT